MKLSIICPGIRVNNWQQLYNSILKSFHCQEWEIIFVGPYPLPEELWDQPNTRCIQDWGSPIRCQQIGLLESRGEWITWAADDGEYLPHALDIAFHRGEYCGDDKIVVMGKYQEGEDKTNHMMAKEYYILANHDASRSKWLPKEYLMLNCGIVKREILMHLGGWDCGFEVCPMAYNDLAIRLQNHGCKFIIQDECMFKCSHLPGHAGDHGPVHDAQILFDQPRFRDIYSQSESATRARIDLNTWQGSPRVWERRFGKEKEFMR